MVARFDPHGAEVAQHGEHQPWIALLTRGHEGVFEGSQASFDIVSPKRHDRVRVAQRCTSARAKLLAELGGERQIACGLVDLAGSQRGDRLGRVQLQRKRGRAGDDVDQLHRTHGFVERGLFVEVEQQSHPK